MTLYQRLITVIVNDETVDAFLVYDDPLHREERMDALSFQRLLRHLGEDDLEFLRDEFVNAAMIDTLRPQYDDLECYSFADAIQDLIETRRHGRVITERTE